MATAVFRTETELTRLRMHTKEIAKTAKMYSESYSHIIGN